MPGDDASVREKNLPDRVVPLVLLSTPSPPLTSKRIRLSVAVYVSERLKNHAFALRQMIFGERTIGTSSDR